MFGDQQPKRKGISKEPDRAISGSGEAKLLDAVEMLTLNLEWRVAQLIMDEAVKTMQDPCKQVLLSPRAVGNAARTSAYMRATMCFVVPADDNHVQ